MNRYPVELLDEYIKLQDVVNDHQIRGIIIFKEHIDTDRFKKSVNISFDYVPVLRCKYSQTGNKALWEESDYTDDDFFCIRNTNNISKENIVEYLKKIPGNNGPQIFVQIICQDANDVAIITVNHMAFDGSGLKLYLYLLSKIYSNDSIDKINLDRRMNTLFKNISAKQKFLSLFRKTYNRTKIEILSDKNDDIETRLGLFKIDVAEFQIIKGICKKSGITINDFILTLFFHAIFCLEHEKIDRVTIQIMFDLRRYINKYPVSQFGNFSSMESMTIVNKNQSFFDLSQEISEYMRKIKSHFPGIKNVLIMNSLFEFLPRNMFDRILSREIQSLGISASNLGIIDDKKLCFSGHEIIDAYMLTSIKNQPAIQLSFSTFKDTVTMSMLGNYSMKNWEIVEKLIDTMSRDVNVLTSEKSN
jgi:NRPS condensation-like uncharacterized protein